MLQEKELLIATKPFAKENRLLSWWCLLSTIAVQAALFAVTWMDLPLWIRIPAAVAAGLTFVRLFCIYHDFAHHSMLHGSKTAKFLMYVYGIVGLSPPSIWIRSHDHHHTHNSKLHGTGIGSYPVMTVKEWASATKGQRFGYAATRHPLTIACGYVTIFLYGMCLRSFLVSPRRHWDSAISLAVHAAICVWFAMCGWDKLILAMWVPISVSAAAGSFLFYAQHNFPGVHYGGRDNWSYVKAALNSSSYIDTNPIMHWFTANIGYHHVHHLNHRIPFYRLPETMAAFEELQSPPTLTLHPRDILSCFRCKLWNEEENRYVGFDFQPIAKPVQSTSDGGTDSENSKKSLNRAA